MPLITSGCCAPSSRCRSASHRPSSPTRCAANRCPPRMNNLLGHAPLPLRLPLIQKGHGTVQDMSMAVNTTVPATCLSHTGFAGVWTPSHTCGVNRATGPHHGSTGPQHGSTVISTVMTARLPVLPGRPGPQPLHRQPARRPADRRRGAFSPGTVKLKMILKMISRSCFAL